MRSRPVSRLTQPWSMAMQMAEMPKPWAAMLQGDQAWLRSRIRPLTGLASYQKYSKAVRCRLSSRASVVRPLGAAFATSSLRSPAADDVLASSARATTAARTVPGPAALAWCVLMILRPMSCFPSAGLAAGHVAPSQKTMTRVRRCVSSR